MIQWRSTILFYIFLFSQSTLSISSDNRHLILENDKNIIFEGGVDSVAHLGIILTKKGVTDFRKKHDLKKDATLYVQKISSWNSVRLNEKEYFLDDLVPLNLFAPDAKYVFEDEEETIPSVNLYTKDYEDESLLLSNDRDGNLQSITIFNKKDGSSMDLKPIAPSYLAKVHTNDANVEELAKRYRRSEGRLVNFNPSLVVENLRKDVKDGVCLWKKVVQLATVYESSFCKETGGKEGAWDEMIRIVAAASQKYGQIGVCAEFQITYLEGFCAPARDPYKRFLAKNRSGCNGFGLLDEFKQFWQTRRFFVIRDTTHMFTGTGLECNERNGCVVGCAFISSICSDEGYGISHATFSSNSNMRAVLVAHEIGHNFGAKHNPSNTDYIMYPSVNDAPLGFSTESKQSFNQNVFLCVRRSLNHEISSKIRSFISDFVRERWQRWKGNREPIEDESAEDQPNEVRPIGDDPTMDNSTLDESIEEEPIGVESMRDETIEDEFSEVESIVYDPTEDELIGDEPTVDETIKDESSEDEPTVNETIGDDSSLSELIVDESFEKEPPTEEPVGNEPINDI